MTAFTDYATWLQTYGERHASGLTRVTLNMDEVQEASASFSAPTTRERKSDSRDSSPSGGSDCSSLATKWRRTSPRESVKSAG